MISTYAYIWVDFLCVCDFFEFKDLFVLFLILKVIMRLTLMLMISVCFSRAQNCKERYFTIKLQILICFFFFYIFHQVIRSRKSDFSTTDVLRLASFSCVN